MAIPHDESAATAAARAAGAIELRLSKGPRNETHGGQRRSPFRQFYAVFFAGRTMRAHTGGACFLRATRLERKIDRYLVIVCLHKTVKGMMPRPPGESTRGKSIFDFASPDRSFATTFRVTRMRYRACADRRKKKGALRRVKLSVLTGWWCDAASDTYFHALHESSGFSWQWPGSST